MGEYSVSLQMMLLWLPGPTLESLKQALHFQRLQHSGPPQETVQPWSWCTKAHAPRHTNIQIKQISKSLKWQILLWHFNYVFLCKFLIFTPPLFMLVYSLCSPLITSVDIYVKYLFDHMSPSIYFQFDPVLLIYLDSLHPLLSECTD